MEETDSVTITPPRGACHVAIWPWWTWEDAPRTSPALVAAKWPGGSEVHRALLEFSSELAQGSGVREGRCVSGAEPHQLVSGSSRDTC